MPASDSSVNPLQADVRIQWGVKIPLRDGIHLQATVYLPKNHSAASPAIFTLTPYVSQQYHLQALYFAAHGYPFLTVDVRGRGNSEGVFRPNWHERWDGYDVVEWLARQPYCNGKVSMWGGSYGGFAQWVTASENPAHLATIVPVAAPFMGTDFPMSHNIPRPYLMRWLTLVAGRTSQDKMFWSSEEFWGARFREWHESGRPFSELDSFLGMPSLIFHEWNEHPCQDSYWDSYNPTSAEYAKLSLPILTITGIYDADQLGALTHYREHLRHAAGAARERHFLVIGPWDHAGTRQPAPEFCGLKVGPAGLLDLPRLHREWYAWTMEEGPRPEFLKRNVAYYVMGAERWRYSNTLDAVTSGFDVLYLHSTGNPTDVFSAGFLTGEPPHPCEPDAYIYDPADVSLAELESTIDPENRADQCMVQARSGSQLVYHSAPFEHDTDICGFFTLSLWLAIDQPDTDLRAAIYDVGIDGSVVQLAFDCMRARYREGLRRETLIEKHAVMRYEFRRFTFVARQIRRRHRLRLVVGPLNSIYFQKNYNSGRVVSRESIQDARRVTVRLFHDELRPSVLHVPIGQAQEQV